MSVQDDPKNPLLDPRVRARLMEKKPPGKSKEARVDLISRLGFHKAKQESALHQKSVTTSESQKLAKENSQQNPDTFQKHAKADTPEKGPEKIDLKQRQRKTLLMRVSTLRRRKASKDSKPNKDWVRKGRKRASKESNQAPDEPATAMPAPAVESDKREDPIQEVKEEPVAA
ncbi:hypothetical protein Aduo_006887 [Ancylostoma duodenale]